MSLALAAAILLQADPRIERVERLTGDAQRPTLWTPLRITVSSGRGFRGEVVVDTSYNVAFARGVELSPGGRKDVLIPAVDPTEVRVGDARERLPVRGTAVPWLVGVDARLGYADGLASGERFLFRKLTREDLQEFLPGGALEAFDALLLADAEGLPLGAYGVAGVWGVAPDRPAAEAVLSRLEHPRRRLEAVDPPLWQLAPRGGWVPAKRNFTLVFAALYALAGFGGLMALARWRPALAVPGAAVLALLFAGVYFLFFPAGQFWVTEYVCEVAPREGAGGEWKVWFVGSAAEGGTVLRFPRLVKPVFPSPRGSDPQVTVRVGGQGCTVEGVRLKPGGMACFAGAAERPAPSLRCFPALTAPLYRATLLVGNRNRALGDLSAGAEVPPSVLEDEPAPREPDYLHLGSRPVVGDSLFGWLDPGEGPARDVHSPDVADQRRRPGFFVQRLK